MSGFGRAANWDGDAFERDGAAAHSGAATVLAPSSGSTAQAGDTGASLSQELDYIAGVSSGGYITAVSNWTWNSDTPPTFNPTSSGAHKFGSTTAGTAGTITYFFDPASHWTATEQADIVSCMTIWSWVANVTFKAASSAATAAVDIIRDANEQAAYSTVEGTSAVGSHVVNNTASGQVVIGATVEIGSSLQTQGGYAYLAIEHEFGHVLGLGHGGSYNGDVDPATQQYGVYDNTAYSIMSYIDPSDSTAKYFNQYPVSGFAWGTSDDGYNNYSKTPAILDILDAQRLYGKPTNSPLNGNDIFGFNTNLTGGPAAFYDFTVDTTPIVTIFDLGTHNTLDLSGFSTPSIVNLNPGTFSSAGGLKNNIGIAYSTIVETAIGGSGSDSLLGSSANNVLLGNGGNDTLNGGAGADNLYGGSGNDVYRVDNISDHVFESAGQGTDTVYTSVSYSLTAGQSVDLLGTISIADTTSIDLIGNGLAQRINGNNGNNVIAALGGGDALYGYGGNDTYRVYTAADRVFEAANQGTDAVFTSGSYALLAGQSVETLGTFMVSGTTAINLTGNEIGQRINGNNGDNVIAGGGGNDLIYGFSGNDHLIGGAGRDIIDGGAGNDVFVFGVIADSTGLYRDLVLNANLSADKFDFGVVPDSIHATVTNGALNTGNFSGDLVRDIGSSQLGVGQAVLFDPSSGDLDRPDHLFLIVDANGQAGYQVGQDFVVELQSTTGTLTLDDFI